MTMTQDESRAVTDRWRSKFGDAERFDKSVRRFFELVANPSASRFDAWLSEDQERDALAGAAAANRPGIVEYVDEWTDPEGPCRHCQQRVPVSREDRLCEACWLLVGDCPALRSILAGERFDRVAFEAQQAPQRRRRAA